MANSFEVIDADGHITEEDNQLKKYMEAKYRDRAATLTPRDSWDRSERQVGYPSAGRQKLAGGDG